MMIVFVPESNVKRNQRRKPKSGVVPSVNLPKGTVKKKQENEAREFRL